MLVYRNLKSADVLAHFRDRFVWMDSVLHIRSLKQVGTAVRQYNDHAGADSNYYDWKTTVDLHTLKLHNGFEITGQVYGRLDNTLGGIMNTDEEDANSVYKAKIQGEFGWDWINSRFFKYRYKQQAIRLDNEIERVQNRLKSYELVYDVATTTVTQQFDSIIAGVMLSRLKNLDVLNEAFQMMLEQDRITSGKMLEVMNDKMQIEFDLSQIFAGRMPASESIALLSPTTITVDTLQLARAVADNNPQSRLTDLQVEKLQNEEHLQSYLGTMRLTPFARWSTYMNSHSRLSHNADVGVRFTIPLWNQTRSKRRSLQIEQAILKATSLNRTTDIMTQCRSDVDLINRLNQSISVEYAHQRELRRYLAMRRNTYRQNEGRYSYIDRLMEYNEYLKSLERMYKQMKQRSITVIGLQKSTGLLDFHNIITEKTL